MSSLKTSQPLRLSRLRWSSTWLRAIAKAQALKLVPSSNFSRFFQRVMLVNWRMSLAPVNPGISERT